MRMIRIEGEPVKEQIEFDISGIWEKVVGEKNTFVTNMKAYNKNFPNVKCPGCFEIITDKMFKSQADREIPGRMMLTGLHKCGAFLKIFHFMV